MQSKYFELVKWKYDSGRWSKKMLRLLVLDGRLLASEYLKITGEVY